MFRKKSATLSSGIEAGIIYDIWWLRRWNWDDSITFFDNDNENNLSTCTNCDLYILYIYYTLLWFHIDNSLSREYLPRIELHWIDIFEYFLTDIDYFPSTPMLTPIDASGFLVRLWIRVKSVVINRVVYRLTSMYASRRVGRK